MRKLKAELSAKSLDNLVKEIKNYQASLPTKCRIFIDRLANEIGIPVIKENIATAKGDSDKNSNCVFQWHETKHGAYGTLVVENKDILFIEFGAGIIYNKGKKHPKADEFGYGVGTYPGQIHAFDEEGWFYWDGTKRIPSKGTEATMPVNKAYISMVDGIVRIAKEVFSQ